MTVESNKAKYTAELGSGSSYYSQHEAALYFGLGTSSTVERITVRWPNGNTQVWRNIDPKKPVHLIEGKPN